MRDVVRKHSDFVGHPIRMKVWRDSHDAAAAPIFEDRTLNSRKAIWDRAKSEVTTAEYNELYRHISHDWQEPLLTVPAKMEGTFEAHALLFVPRQAPPDLYSPEMKRGLQLYVKRVFVMDECKDLMPQHLRFVKGVLDAHDLSLNVSREMLQKDRQIQTIRRQLVKKVTSSLEDLQRNKPDDYLTFWAAMGAVLKEGLLGFDVPDKDKLLDLVMAASTADATKLTSLNDYIGRMKDGQDAIYFITAPSLEAARRSPLLEAYVKKGYEVLLFADAVDELWLDRAPRYKDKAFQSVGHGEAKLGTEDERKQAAAALEEKQKGFSDLLVCLRVHLQDEVKDVRLSARLTSSAVCLVGDEDDMTPRMRKILEQMGQKAPPLKRILEVNPDHPLFGKLQAVFAENRDDPRLRSFARVLLGQAHLAESGHMPDPAAFNEALADLMLRAA